jgi:precorrin-8X/cobalt-precorrin-8 methylmutase
MQYLSDPMEIERRSMAIIESEVPTPRPYAGICWQVVRRMIHTSADFELLNLVRFHPDAVISGMAALAGGCTIFTDTRMACMGIPRRRLAPLGCRVVSFMSEPDVAAEARQRQTTMSVVAVDRAVADPTIQIYVIGNAPTALLRLLERIEAGDVRPALVVAMPVGFVNATESKALFMEKSPAPYIAVEGRKGGSPMAACVVNALAQGVLDGVCPDTEENSE